LVTGERNEGRRKIEERGFGGRKKIVVACPYRTARQGRKGRGDVAAREFDAKPRVLLA
jgi:hypothetical protein